MKAIILAAGMGTRLGDYTKNLPKCMLNFIGKPLIERQIETLRSCGINDIIVVKGYMPNKINIPNVRYYINEDYKNTNMVESLFTAESEITKEVLVCYGDILYEKGIIEKILKNKADIGVAVDKDYQKYWKARLDNPKEDTESLVIDQERIIELGDPNCSMEKAQVRYVGLIRFSKKGIKALKKVYHENHEKYFNIDKPWMKSKSFKKAYMTCMLQALIDSGYELKPIYISKGWLEFDTSTDYEKYNKWHNEGILKKFFRID